MHIALAPSQKFSEAASLWIESRKFRSPNARARFIAPATLTGYESYLRALNRFFADITLADIHAGHLHEYQEQRISGKLAPAPRQRKDKTEYFPHETSKVSPHKVNQELGLLQMIMKRAGCWSDELKDLYEPLQMSESNVPKALSPSEQERWLTTAASRREWAVVYWYSIVAFSTTASNCEMRGIRLGDVQIDSGSVAITSVHAKNKYRIRSVPLNDDALWAIGQLLKRALHLRASSPQHYLFPFHVAKHDYDPNRPMSVSGLKKPWNEIRAACHLEWFTPHDTRHTAISRMAEVGVPIPTIMSIAGHMSAKMTLHYTWISEQVKRHAVAIVERKRKQAFGVTPWHIPTPPARVV
jgi:site-specific recombinase XerD